MLGWHRDQKPQRQYDKGQSGRIGPTRIARGLGEAVLENTLQLEAKQNLHAKHLHPQFIECNLDQFL
jgi:hypothetical protein